MNAVLGGLFSSRINLNLREAHGYTYGAFSAFEWRRAAGPFVDPDGGEERRDRCGGRARSCIEIERMRSEEISDGRAVARDELSRRRVPDPLRDDGGDRDGAGEPRDLRPARRLLRRVPRARPRRDDGRTCFARPSGTCTPTQLRVVVVGDPAVIATPLAEVTARQSEIVTPDGDARRPHEQPEDRRTPHGRHVRRARRREPVARSRTRSSAASASTPGKIIKLDRDRSVFPTARRPSWRSCAIRARRPSFPS